MTGRSLSLSSSPLSLFSFSLSSHPGPSHPPEYTPVRVSTGAAAIARPSSDSLSEEKSGGETQREREREGVVGRERGREREREGERGRVFVG